MIIVMKTRRIAPLLFACIYAAFPSFGQGTITFDGPPVQPIGTVYGIQHYSESDMLFTPIGFNFGRAGGGIQQLPENGSAYLQAALSQSLQFSFTNGSSFNLVAVDLAEYSTVVPDAVTVPFYGYRTDGSVVFTSFTTDGIIDGTGPLADFQTFYFGPEFSNLLRVEIPTFGWSLDNLVISIPEPSSLALVLASGVIWLAARGIRPKPIRS